MILRITKYTLQILIAIVGAIILLGLAFAWRLTQGAVYIPQLTPYITQAISQNIDTLDVKIGETVLSWEGWQRNLDIKILDTQIYLKNGEHLASIPQAALSLSGKALLKGVIAPSSIYVDGADVVLSRGDDGKVTIALGDGKTVTTDQILKPQTLLGNYEDIDLPLSFLNAIDIGNANVRYKDAVIGNELINANANLHLERFGETIVLNTDLSFQIDNQPTLIHLDASYNLTTNIVDAQSRLADVNLANLSALHPVLSPLSILEFNAEGQIKAAFDLDANLRSFEMDVTGKSGFLNIAEPYQQRLGVDGMVLRASLDENANLVKVSEFVLALQKGSVIELQAPYNDFVPLEVVRGQGVYDQVNDQLTVDQFQVELGDGPILDIKLSSDGFLKKDNKELSVTGLLKDVMPDKLHRYWPKGLNDNARDWILENISKGIVSRTEFKTELSISKDQDIQINVFEGDMDIENIDVQYLAPLPVVNNVSGHMVFNDKELTIVSTSGTIDNIAVEKAKIHITGLDEYDQRLDLELIVNSPLREAMRFIDQDPLNFANALGVDPENFSGTSQTELTMSFLLLNDLEWDGVEIKAKTNAKNLNIKNAYNKKTVSADSLSLVVDKQGMEVNGDIMFATIPAKMKWRENFNQQTLFKRRFVLNAKVDDLQRQVDLELNFPPFNDNVLSGVIPMDVTITQNWHGEGDMEVFANLTPSEINLPLLEWQKPAGQPVNAYTKVTFNDKQITAVPYFSLDGEMLRGAGSIALNPNDASLQTMTISRFKAGRTEISQATILHHPKVGWEVDVQGKGLDLTSVLEKSKQTQIQTNESDAFVESKTGIEGTFSGRFDEVFVDDKFPVKSVAGAIKSDGVIWTEAHLTGQVDGQSDFVLDLSPKETNRRLKLSTMNAGGLLRALDLFDDIKDGNLVVEATLNDNQINRPLVGTIMIDNYRVTKVPALAKVLSLAALTGVVDSLQGEGIGFSNLTAPFKYDRGVLEFKEGRTNGISIGLTWNGKIYTYADIADIKGTIVPAYGLNSFLGNVPIVGDLFSAGEKGGGLFAWTYELSGKVEDPDVSVNPVSALAPGFLRKLFQLDNSN